MAVRHLSGIESFPLATTGSDNPSLSPGAEVQFQMGGLPEVEGNLVWKVLGIFLTIAYTLTQAGGTGVRLSELDVYRAIIANVRVTGGFFGDSLRPNMTLGQFLPTMEFVQSGYNYFSPKRSFIPAANGANARQIDIFIPINFFGCNVAPHHTAQLSSFYQQATFGLTPAAAAVLTAMSPGATLSAMSMRASAWMMLDSDIVVSPGIEWNAYQTPFAAGTTTNFLNMGQATGLDGVLPGAGFLWAGLLTSARGQGGAFAGNNLTALGFPFRSQKRTVHNESVGCVGFAQQNAGRRLGSVADAATVGALTDFDGSPHLFTDNVAGVGTDQIASSIANANLAAVQIVSCGTDMNLSNVQHVEGSLPIDIEVASGSGNQVLLALQAKRYAQAKMDAAAALLLSRGVIQAVNGGRTDGAWVKKMASFQPGFSNSSEARYLPVAWRAPGRKAA